MTMPWLDKFCQLILVDTTKKLKIFQMSAVVGFRLAMYILFLLFLQAQIQQRTFETNKTVSQRRLWHT